MISGHWHNGDELDSLIYIGSYERWAFNEEDPKGFGFIQIDTETNEYFYQKIINQFAPDYITYNIETNIYNSIDDYKKLVDIINIKLKEKNNENIKIRIVVNITDDKLENETYITSLRKFFINNKLIKIVVKNKLKKDKNEIVKKKNIETKSKYGFILDKSISEAEKIQEFILATKNKEIPIDTIESFIKKYIS